MDFSTTGLPNDPKVQQAFDHAYAVATGAASTARLQARMEHTANEWLQYQLDQLDETPDMSPAVREQRRYALHGAYAAHLKTFPEEIRKSQEGSFILDTLAVALSFVYIASDASADLIALALLRPAAQRLEDIEDIEKKFGPAYAAVLHELQLIDGAPLLQAELLRQASAPAKSLMIAGEGQILQALVKHYTRQEERHMPLPDFADAEAQRLFDNLKAVWGHDARLEDHYQRNFNTLCGLLSAPFRIAVATDGGIVLTRPQGNNAAMSSDMTPRTGPQPAVWN